MHGWMTYVWPESGHQRRQYGPGGSCCPWDWAFGLEELNGPRVGPVGVMNGRSITCVFRLHWESFRGRSEVPRPAPARPRPAIDSRAAALSADGGVIPNRPGRPHRSGERPRRISVLAGRYAALLSALWKPINCSNGLLGDLEGVGTLHQCPRHLGLSSHPFKSKPAMKAPACHRYEFGRVISSWLISPRGNFLHRPNCMSWFTQVHATQCGSWFLHQWSWYGSLLFARCSMCHRRLQNLTFWLEVGDYGWHCCPYRIGCFLLI